MTLIHISMRAGKPEAYRQKRGRQFISENQKYRFPSDPNHFISHAVPGPHTGAFRDRHERRAGDAMDADALLTNGADADGEVVWS
jgi:hypothetical protein